LQPLPSLKEAREAAVRKEEARYLRKMMAQAGSDIQEGCRISGLSRPQLYALLKKHNLSLKETSTKG